MVLAARNVGCIYTKSWDVYLNIVLNLLFCFLSLEVVISGSKLISDKKICLTSSYNESISFLDSIWFSIFLTQFFLEIPRIHLLKSLLTAFEGCKKAKTSFSAKYEGKDVVVLSSWEQDRIYDLQVQKNEY